MTLTIKIQENIYFLLEWEEWKGQLDQTLSTIIPKQNIILNFVLQKNLYVYLLQMKSFQFRSLPRRLALCYLVKARDGQWCSSSAWEMTPSLGRDVGVSRLPTCCWHCLEAPAKSQGCSNRKVFSQSFSEGLVSFPFVTFRNIYS